jgi:hypothetical protein
MAARSRPIEERCNHSGLSVCVLLVGVIAVEPMDEFSLRAFIRSASGGIVSKDVAQCDVAAPFVTLVQHEVQVRDPETGPRLEKEDVAAVRSQTRCRCSSSDERMPPLSEQISRGKLCETPSSYLAV